MIKRSLSADSIMLSRGRRIRPCVSALSLWRLFPPPRFPLPTPQSWQLIKGEKNARMMEY